MDGERHERSCSIDQMQRIIKKYYQDSPGPSFCADTPVAKAETKRAENFIVYVVVEYSMKMMEDVQVVVSVQNEYRSRAEHKHRPSLLSLYK